MGFFNDAASGCSATVQRSELHCLLHIRSRLLKHFRARQMGQSLLDKPHTAGLDPALDAGFRNATPKKKSVPTHAPPIPSSSPS